MMNFFEHCADIASVGIIVDFTGDLSLIHI